MEQQDMPQQLQHCQERFQELLKWARQDKWQAVEQGASECQRQLKALEMRAVPAADAAEVRMQLSNIRALHQELMTLIQTRRESTLKQLRKDTKGQKMKAAYGKTQRP